jgi:Transcription factor WhiB
MFMNGHGVGPVESWRELSLCALPEAAGVDWHGKNPGPRSEAALWCMACPVRLICLEDAMETERGFARGSRSSIYGALTAKERCRLEAQRQEERRRLEEQAEEVCVEAG